MNLFFIAIFSLFFFISCSNSDSFTPPADDVSEPSLADTTEISPATEDSIPEITIEGMLRLAGGKVTLGTNDKNFKENERPAMEVVLNYDFYMGIHEVTCGEYAEVAKKAKLKTFGTCENDSLPLTDITYYDAVLFANAKSKLEKRDTVYTYRSALLDGENHCTNLEGFAFHADVDGFRLPTEAEWVYAATRAWDLKKSWNNSNSGYKLHPVCSKEADSVGLCDMAGNAMEWVNDWMGSFRDTTVTNYAGAPNGGDIGERVVKGGCYTSSEKELNPYSRGDVYTVTSSTRAEYVGFRLAFGSIPNALWMNEDGQSVSSIVTPLAGSATIKELTGSYNVKLAFRNDVTGNIAYLDYRNDPLIFKEITEGINAYHPEISPDGEWIAFSTSFEGVSEKSAIYVQNLESDTAISIKLKAENAAIPRWRILENGDTVIVYVSDAGNNKDEASFKSASTWQVKFMNGKFGKPQKLFEGAYHGGISEDNTLAVSGARLLRARIAKNGSTVTDNAKDVIWYDSAQACNVSLSQDGTKRTAFLDFGGKPGKKFVGENYATHQRVLIADSTGKLIQSIKAPTGYTFDHTEWATDGEKSVIVATLTNVNGAHPKIALIYPEDNNVTEIAEGDELWHPNLWIKKKNNKSSSESDTLPAEQGFKLDPDSAGIYYNSSGAHDKADQWRYKMEFLWQYKDTANVVIIGSSRAYFGINPLRFKDPFFAINLSVATNPHKASYLFLRDYVLPHMKKLKYVIKDLDIERWLDVSGGIFGSAYKSYPGYMYDKNHNYWKDNYPAGLAEATFNSPGVSFTQNALRSTRGFREKDATGWGEPYTSRDSTWLDKFQDNYRKNFNYLVNMIEECKKNNVVLVGLLTPENPRYTETGSYGKQGIRRSEAPAIIKEINDLSKKYPNFILMDENKMGYHDYTDEMAFDTDHLSKLGAQQLSNRLDSLLRTLE